MPQTAASPITEPRDLIAAVLDHAQRSPERTCVETFSRRTPIERRSFAQVAEGAGRAAALLYEQGLRRGEVVLFLGTHHIDFYPAWLGCVWLGAIPTVLAEPTVRIDKKVYWSRLGELIRRIEAWGVAADPRIKIEQQLAAIPRMLRYDEIASGAGPVPSPISPRPDETLLLQHSSGTTGLQKGVMLSHEAVRRHAESYNRRLQLLRIRSHRLLAAALSRHGFHRLLRQRAVAGSAGRVAVAL